MMTLHKHYNTKKGSIEMFYNGETDKFIEIFYYPYGENQPARTLYKKEESAFLKEFDADTYPQAFDAFVKSVI